MPTRRRGVDFPRPTWMYSGRPPGWPGLADRGVFFVHEEVSMGKLNECEKCEEQSQAGATQRQIARHVIEQHEDVLEELAAAFFLAWGVEQGKKIRGGEIWRGA